MYLSKCDDHMSATLLSYPEESRTDLRKCSFARCSRPAMRVRCVRACVRAPESIHRRVCPVQDESASGLAAARRRPLCPTPPRCRLPSSAPEPPGDALANFERGSRFLQCRRGPAAGRRNAPARNFVPRTGFLSETSLTNKIAAHDFSNCCARALAMCVCGKNQRECVRHFYFVCCLMQ